MKSCLASFNCNLLLLLLFLCAGCETTQSGTKTAAQKAEAKKQKKERSFVALYLESGSKANAMNSVPVYRQSPVYISVQAEPFLTLGNLADAAVVDVEGGLAIQLRFDSQGAFILENMTAANRGRRVAVFAAFPPEKRWLAAPLITQSNPTGALTFTPDATREEAERIVRGLHNAITDARKRGN